MRLAVALLFVLSSAAFPQGFGGIFEKAPPEIDRALRERIEGFYKAQMARNWGQALQFVHPDSQDAFIGADKMTYKGFRIANITWDEKYSSAKALMDFDAEFHFPGFGKRDVHVPFTSVWKNVDGKWLWYAVPFNSQTGKDSPFGPMFKGTDPNAPSGGAPAPDIGKMMEQGPSLAQIRSSVNTDKREVVLKSHIPSEDSITIVNKFDGPVHVRLDADELPCLSTRLEKTVIEAGQSAKAFFSCKPENGVKKPDGRAQITIEEIGKVIPVQITFAFPPFDPATGNPVKP